MHALPAFAAALATAVLFCSAPHLHAEKEPPVGPSFIDVSTTPDGIRSNSAGQNAAFPAEAPFFINAPTGSWMTIGTISFEVVLPTNAPPDVQILMYVKDLEYLWFQNLLPGFAAPGRATKFTVDMSPEAAPSWKSVGHQAPWHLLSLHLPREVGIRVFSKNKWSGPIAVRSFTATRRRSSGPPSIANLRVNKSFVPCYDKFEISCTIPDRYNDPFDSDEVMVSADIIDPRGVTNRIAGFYTQEYYREPSFDPDAERIMPQGLPLWKIRFSPATVGTHRYVVRVRDRFGSAQTAAAVFEAAPSENSGFVRVSRKDPRFYEFDNGEPFFPIGHNIRSPFDTRMNGQFPWAQRWPEGSLAYRRFFQRMHENSANMVEIWTAPWSLGLEWSTVHPGYAGIGHYNLIHAWELDRIVEDAGSKGIYINLVIHNHGKFSSFSDPEWVYNPFSKANGGYLEDPDDYFTDPRALKSFVKLMRYMTARWGYSRNIFAWQLWSELNLTGAQRRGGGIHHRSEIVDWHRLMGRSIKDMDPNDHIISSHVSGDHNTQNDAICMLPEIGSCSVDAYHGNSDPLYIVDLMRDTAIHNNRFGKPVLITEFGGSAMAQGLRHLDDTLHCAVWASVATPIGGTPMLWWWQLIDEENFYPRYAALARFMAGEDRRDRTFLPYDAQLLPASGSAPACRVQCMKSPSRALGWIARTDFGTIDPDTKTSVTNLTISMQNMKVPSCSFEFWDTRAGKPVFRTTVPVKNGAVRASIPPFARDIAFKAIPEDGEMPKTPSRRKQDRTTNRGR